MRMGLREANQNFSKAIRAVKAGKEVVLTERGKAIAVIRPVYAEEQEEETIKRLVAEGFLRPAIRRGRLPPIKPVHLKGDPILKTLRDLRDEE